MDILYQKLQAYLENKREDTIFLTVFRGLILFVGGIVITHGLRLNNYFYVILGIGFALVYTYLEYRRLKTEDSFPIKILEHLRAKENLTAVSKNLKRKEKIDNYITKSLSGLNNSTCPVLFSTNPDVCKKDLANGLYEILFDLVQRINYVLDIDETEFSIGVFVNGYFKKIAEYNENTLLEQHGSFISFRDDLGLSSSMPPDMTDISRSRDNQLQLHKILIETLNHDKFISECVDLNGIGHTVISSPIPSCGGTPDGILYIIHSNQIEPPEDLENVLEIFGGIVSNWIAKYNSCVWEDFERKKRNFLNITTPEFCIEESDIKVCSVCPPWEEDDDIDNYVIESEVPQLEENE